MKRLVKQKICFVALAMTFIVGVGLSCKKVPIVYATTDEVNIVGYIDEHLDSFSLFRQMLAVTGYDGFLNAYGHYTLFLPTNTAVHAYLKNEGVDSVSQMNVDSVKNFLKFHLLSDTVYTISFTDGKLPDLTMYGQYLVTGASNVDGTTYYTVNRQANIIQSNLREGNGVIHVIDHVLLPATQTLAQLISTDTKYSIFAQALKATGLYDSLNILPQNNKDSLKAWLTVLAQSDSVFNTDSIYSYDDLKAKYCNTGDPTNSLDSLHLFMDYHIFNRANYLADIISSTAFTTWAPLQAITVKYSHDSILINDDVFNGVHEPGILISRSGSDLSATNGVLHDAIGLLYIKQRSPFPIYWDVCQYPEIMDLPAYYGKQSYQYTYNNLPSFVSEQTTTLNLAVEYVWAGISATGSSPVVNGDYLQIPMGGPNRPAWVTLTTPLIVAGTYKVWICYRTASGSMKCQVAVDSTVMQRTFTHANYLPTGVSDAVLEAENFKNYTIGNTKYSNVPAYCVGTVTIGVTGTHTITFTTLSGTDSNFWLDMIEFIPADQDQQWPRFDVNGIAHYSATD